MDSQHPFTSEPSPAVVTPPLVVILVHPLMIPEMRSSRKRLPTVVTFIRFDATVGDDVSLELVRPVELLHATGMTSERALESFTRVVNGLMSLQFVFAIKGGATLVTFEWFRAGMNQHMHLEVVISPEAFPTNATRQVCTAVSDEMSPQVALTREDLIAVRTRVVVGGGRHVMLQRLRGSIFIVAFVTLEEPDASLCTLTWVQTV